MPRFTVARHELQESAKSHYDLFLERGGTLKNWRMIRVAFEEDAQAFEGRDHKLKYLDYEGPLSDNRGDVKIWDTGEYVEDAWTADMVQVALQGQKIRTRLRLSRQVGSADPPVWTVRDLAPPLRRLTSTLLREPAPDPPPSSELDRLAEELGAKEHHLVSLATQFLHGAPVEWSLAVADTDLRSRIRGALARWRHPWLEAAERRAQVLEELAGRIASFRPPEGPAGP